MYSFVLLHLFYFSPFTIIVIIIVYSYRFSFMNVYAVPFSHTAIIVVFDKYLQLFKHFNVLNKGQL